MKILKLLPAFALFFSLAACSDDDNGNNPSGSAKQLMPLKTGNYWVYRSTTPYSVLVDTFSIKVTGTVEVQGKSCYTIKHDRYSAPILYSIKADGVYEVNPYNANYDNIVYKYPCSVGDKYQAFRFTAPYQVESVTEIVTVPAGTFTCIKYTIIGRTTNALHIDVTRIIDWVCPGIGLIKSECDVYSTATQSYDVDGIDELTSYSI